MRAQFEKVPPADNQSFRSTSFACSCFDYPWHFHPEYELTLIVESRGRRFVGDHVENFTEGDLVFLGPDLPHCWYNSARDGHRQARSIVVQFREDFLGAGFWKVPEAHAVERLLARSRRGLKVTGLSRERIARQMMELVELKGMPKLLHFISILDSVARAKDVQELSSPSFAPACNTADEARIGRVIDFVNRNFTRSIDQPAAAKVASLTPAAFSRFFVRRTLRTFSSFVNEVRIGHACKLLLENEDLTSAEVCFACGFENLSNFNRRFRKLKGMSPQEYRRMFVTTL